MTDCKSLALVANGRTPLLHHELAPEFESVTNNLFKLVGAGCKPASDDSDFIWWRPRRWNRRSDHLVNVTIDARQSWHQSCDAPIAFNIDQAQLVVHIDGGCRHETCSGAAWIIEAIVVQDDKRHQFPLFVSGTFIDQNTTAFKAELRALNEALQHTVQLLIP